VRKVSEELEAWTSGIQKSLTADERQHPPAGSFSFYGFLARWHAHEKRGHVVNIGKTEPCFVSAPRENERRASFAERKATFETRERLRASPSRNFADLQPLELISHPCSVVSLIKRGKHTATNATGKCDSH
jgi:hypothetical protein